MAEHEFIEALDSCIDRINAGESLDDCLRDYPQFADHLRGLLAVGDLVYRARVSSAEVAAQQEQLRAQVIDSLQNRHRRPRRNWFVPLMAAASVALVVGFLSIVLMSGYGFNSVLPSPSQLTGTPLMSTNQAIEIALNATQTEAARDHGAETSATLHPAIMPTSGPLDATLAPVSTSVVLMSPMPTGTPVPAMESTLMALGPATVTSATLLPMPTMAAGGAVGAAITFEAPMSPTPLSSNTPPPTQPSGSVPTPVQVIPLKAGEIDDNAEWGTYLRYRNNYLDQYAYSVRDIDVTRRQIITVTDADGLPVLGALVKVYENQTLISETRTYATGKTMFFPAPYTPTAVPPIFTVTVQKGDAFATFELDPRRNRFWNARLESLRQQSPPLKLDVLFLLDSTGSMGDEIAQLQNNILGISSQVAALPGNVKVRYGLVTYRDRGDEYVTQAHNFTANVNTFQFQLNQVRAAGGGDWPESLNEALHVALQRMSWRGEDTVKLIFLVSDAPPHLDYALDYDYSQEVMVALAQGIKIHPIASSGLTPDGEFIFRQLAQITMGRFIFLTYQQGGSGAPGETRTDLNVGEPDNPDLQQEGDYTVEYLDKLVMRLINDEMAALRQPPDLSGALELEPWAATPIPEQQSGQFSFAASNEVNLLLLILLVIVAVFAGYAFRPPVVVSPPKRKNDDPDDA